MEAKLANVGVMVAVGDSTINGSGVGLASGVNVGSGVFVGVAVGIARAVRVYPISSVPATWVKTASISRVGAVAWGEAQALKASRKTRQTRRNGKYDF